MINKYINNTWKTKIIISISAFLLMMPVMKAQNQQTAKILDVNTIQYLNAYAENNFAKTSSIPLLIYLRLAVIDSANNPAYLHRLNAVFQRGVTIEENKVNVSIPPEWKKEAWYYTEADKRYENDFVFVDVNSMYYFGPVDYSEKYKNLNSAQKLAEKLNVFIYFLSEEKESNYGWFWEVLAPYFIALRDNDHIETFSYLISYSTNEVGVKDWILGHRAGIDQFRKWNKDYEW